ncbi:MAG: chemotaxis-specific protein-glutamate methyltransferase CheB [candidate division WOR-3 bacterium]|nr:MAG: chemotaxis-specific protein-glutamate methyltransferase CheB [candidate division WOR-3 bacterium]
MSKRVLIVEDSILMQQLISDIISATDEFEVCGSARDVVEGWAKFNKLKPDVVTLDYELPGENGLALLAKIMNTNPVPVLIISAYTKEGADVTIRSLEMGAVDFFTKPSGTISIDLHHYSDELSNKLKLVAQANVMRRIKKKISPRINEVSELYIGIAASTGGVRTLNYLIPALPVHNNLRVFVVQHMPKYFTASLASHLNERSSLPVKEARDGELIARGEILIAPGGYQTRVDVSGTKVLVTNEPARHGVKPSADILFESMAAIFKEKSVGIVLTGMGRDGADGIKVIKNHRGATIAQEPGDAVISGMPQSAINTGSVDYVLPVRSIPDKILELMRKGA